MDIFLSKPLPGQQQLQPKQQDVASQVSPTTSKLSLWQCWRLWPYSIFNHLKAFITKYSKVAWLGKICWGSPCSFASPSTNKSPACPRHLVFLQSSQMSRKNWRINLKFCGSFINTFLFGSTASRPPATTRQSSRAPATRPALRDFLFWNILFLHDHKHEHKQGRPWEMEGVTVVANKIICICTSWPATIPNNNNWPATIPNNREI